MKAPGDIAAALGRWLEAGFCCIGQIQISREPARFILTHRADAGRDDLVTFTGLEGAREIARYDAEGEYRPLKSAPNLRPGWKMTAPDLPALQAVLDAFYPVALGLHLAHEEDRMATTPFRETAERQSGMYAVVKRMTEAEADRAIAECCRSNGGCLKTICWELAPGQALTCLPPSKFDPQVDQTGGDAQTIPLHCPEACNLLIARAREVVKSRAAGSDAPARSPVQEHTG